jgi:hypothetical protein
MSELYIYQNAGCNNKNLQFYVHVVSILNETWNNFAYSKDIELVLEHYIFNTISWLCYDNYCEQGSVYWNWTYIVLQEF